VGVMDLGRGGWGGYLLDNEEENKKKITDLNVAETTPRAVSYWLNPQRVLHNTLLVLPYQARFKAHPFTHE